MIREGHGFGCTCIDCVTGRMNARTLEREGYGKPHRDMREPVPECLCVWCVSRRQGRLEGVTDRRHTKLSEKTQGWMARAFTFAGKWLAGR